MFKCISLKYNQKVSFNFTNTNSYLFTCKFLQNVANTHWLCIFILFSPVHSSLTSFHTPAKYIDFFLQFLIGFLLPLWLLCLFLFVRSCSFTLSLTMEFVPKLSSQIFSSQLLSSFSHCIMSTTYLGISKIHILTLISIPRLLMYPQNISFFTS